MSYKYNKNLLTNAQTLRKNMTDEEKKFWYDFLHLLPVTAHRQKNIGNYIVDFYIAKNKIAIELDGSQHSEPEQQEKDRERDRFLQSLGITVLRYNNDQIRNYFPRVKQEILQKLDLDSEETYEYMRAKKNKNQ